MTVELLAYPRVHVTLIDTPRLSLFSPGGVGFAVAARPLVLRASLARSARFVGFEHLDDLARSQCRVLVERLTHELRIDGIELQLVGCPPQHRGFGSKSLLMSGIVNASCLIAGAQLPVETRQLMTGRGGTSGIGIHTFFEGGLVVDVGRPTSSGVKTLPSSMVVAESVPMKLARWDMPAIGVLLVDVPGQLHSGEREREIFANGAQFSQDDLGIVMGAVYHGLLPAILARDFGSIANSLMTIHDHGFKSIELREQSVQVRDVYVAIRNMGFACGMSSMGPLIYVLVPLEDAEETRKRVSCLSGVSGVELCEPRNEGYTWRSLDG